MVGNWLEISSGHNWLPAIPLFASSPDGKVGTSVQKAPGDTPPGEVAGRDAGGLGVADNTGMYGFSEL